MGTRTISQSINLQSPETTIDKYITTINQNGIQVHPANNLNNGITIDEAISIISGGQTIASYGKEIVIGDEKGFHIKIGANEQEGRLSFYQDENNEVAYITNNQLYITQSVVLQQMDVGTPLISNYTLTSDSSIVSGKIYYTRSLYYALTTDTQIVESKTYYTRSAEEPYEYAVVTEPRVEDIATYYELFYIYNGVDNPAISEIGNYYERNDSGGQWSWKVHPNANGTNNLYLKWIG